MRRWFVVLLIVLLPWRAWAGDTMVISMAPTLEHAAAAAAADYATADTPHCAVTGEPTVHAACDICNGPLLAEAPWAGTGHEPLPPSRLATGPVRFASALPHPGRKPPIS